MTTTETGNLLPQHQAIIDNVERFGVAVMHVAADDPRSPSYSYSVGFEHTLGAPEVLVYGLDRELAQSMINEIFRQCREDGLLLADALRIGNLIEGYDCMARPIDDPRARAGHFGFANWFRRRNGEGDLGRAMQIVWPDPKTRAFPWEEGCGFDVENWQTQLYPAGTPR